MTSLSTHGRDLIMRAVYAIEQAQRDTLHPDKVNLAALGNMVPHLHWHVIPRWHEDRHFPSPIWAPPRFAAGQEPAEFFTRQQDLQARLHRYRDRVTEVMNALLWH
ncbi:histidine triad domain protein [Bordetella holmesii CDC-H809-BH]|nr:histidine triad domain protein [Bordetella holmesii CDC-H809-BH]